MYSVLVQVFAALPISLLRVIAYFGAMLICLFPNKGLYWTVWVNLSLCYPGLPETQKKNLIRRNIINQCLAIVESLKSWGSKPSYSLNQIKLVHGKALLDSALNSGKGIILIVPHLGSWEVMNPWICQFGLPVIMYKPAKSKALNQIMLTARARTSATMVATNEHGVKTIFKALKTGGVTAILPDHVPQHDSGGVYAPFFGISTLTTTLVCKLAHKTDSQVLSLCCIRRKDLKGFDIYCQALDPAIQDANLTFAVTDMNRQLTLLIDQFKEHYVWSYRRFKRSEYFSNIYSQTKQDILTLRTHMH